jgi:predicted transcriptional regulator
MMGVLERKGHLRRRSEGRSYLYEPARPRQRVLRAMVREFVDRVFDGSARPLLVQLLEERRLSARDLQALKKKVRERR